MAFVGAAVVLAACWGAGAWWRRRAALPSAVGFGLGAASLHVVLFALAASRLVSVASLAALAAACIASLLWLRPQRFVEPAIEPLDRATRIGAIAVFAVYSVVYGIHALAPEIQPDAITYHLGLPAEYLRTGGFPARVAFYEMLPQGVDLLFLWALAFGGYPAAKLVHLAFLAATVPVLVAIVRKLGWPDRVAAGAAVLYGCAPVTGVTAAAAYTDAALVFYALAAFYLMLAGRPFAAGVAAGFCYAVKISGLVLPAAAWVWAAVRRRGMVVLAVGAALMVLPWMLRNWLLAENPLAPLFNGWFPNPHFLASMERDLARAWRTYDGFTWLGAPWDLAVRGRLQGIFGPVFLLLPLGLLALRERRGRILWAAAGVAAMPWFFNVGTRFLLPAAAFAAIALASALPRAALWLVMAAHAALSLPAAMPLYAPRTVWRLEGLPWRAAAGLQSPEAYLGRHDDYQVAGLVEGSTQPGERVFALCSVARAYVTRDTLEFWHNRLGATLADGLRVAALHQHDPLYNWEARFGAQSTTGVRFRLPESHAAEWCIHEVRLHSGPDRVHPSPQWRHTSALPFDGNLATRWRTWEPVRAGVVFDVTFDRSQKIGGAAMISHSPVFDMAAEVWLRAPGGEWQKAADAHAARLPPIDLRRDAARAVKAAGFDYILAPVAEQGMAQLGRALVKDPAAWGLEIAWQSGWAYLLRVR